MKTTTRVSTGMSSITQSLPGGDCTLTGDRLTAPFWKREIASSIGEHDEYRPTQ